MGIPISEYIDVDTIVIRVTGGGRDFSGLVFSDESMISGYEKESDYSAGEVVKLTQSEIAAAFASTSKMYAFATRYFGYGAESLNVVKKITSDTTALAAFNRVTAKFQNFGSFTFLGDTWTTGAASAGGLLNVAIENASMGYLFVRPVTPTNRATEGVAFEGIVGTHLVQEPATTITTGVTCNLAASMPMAWFADVNYDRPNASATIDYAEFAGAVPSVTTLSDKNTCDGLKVNYVGLVQAHGFQRKFYQRGVNTDGMDLGVFRDELWIRGQVEAGWFDLVSAGKVPANMDGATSVRGMVLGVAERAIGNGAILVNKNLTQAQIAQIAQLAGSDDAADNVESVGYYCWANVILSEGKYVCQYILIYAKGDHISKVVGQHVLV